jgi:hypothetical protein
MRPRIHNKKMVAEIRDVIIKHSGNEELADSVAEYISAPSDPHAPDNQPAAQCSSKSSSGGRA